MTKNARKKGAARAARITDPITLQEAAELRGTSRQAVSELVHRGRLRSDSILGRVVVSRAEVRKLKPLRPGPQPERAN